MYCCFLIGFILDFCVHLLYLLLKHINICTFNIRRFAPICKKKKGECFGVLTQGVFFYIKFYCAFGAYKMHQAKLQNCS